MAKPVATAIQVEIDSVCGRENIAGQPLRFDWTLSFAPLS